MKSVLVIIDGVNDLPIPQLGGYTPLEAAFIPNTHYIASRGEIGRIRTTFPGFPIESMVCIMGLLGYEPERFYPSGRASFEAIAKGIPLHQDDLVLRCNTIAIDKDRQVIVDFTAGQIADSDARALLAQVTLPYAHWELFPGQSYRNLLIVRGTQANVDALKCREPHMHIGRPVRECLPCSEDPGTRELAADLSEFLLDTQRQICGMDLPGTCAANMLWVWSPSRKPVWPSFHERTGVRAAVVGGLDFLHGIAMAAKMHFDVVPGATGYIDTNYAAKAACAIRYIDRYDFVLVHINAPDEEAHLHNHLGKIEAIEKIDRYIIGPVLRKLAKSCGGDFRIAVCGDHGTRCIDGKHTDEAVPYALFGRGIGGENKGQSFSESDSAACEPVASIAFLHDVLWGDGR